MAGHHGNPTERVYEQERVPIKKRPVG
jgi:hypothetical protein